MSAGKGDKPRPIKDHRHYGEELDRIFGHGEKEKQEQEHALKRTLRKGGDSCR